MTIRDITAGKHIRLESAFEAVYLATRSPADVAMFANREPEQDYVYYFSPRASELFSTMLIQFSAVDCAAPAREAVVLVLGHADAPERLLRSAAANGKK